MTDAHAAHCVGPSTAVPCCDVPCCAVASPTAVCCAVLCHAVLCCALQVRNVPGDHDLRVADLLELVQLTGLGDR
jgi:hypothetical protein